MKSNDAYAVDNTRRNSVKNTRTHTENNLVSGSVSDSVNSSAKKRLTLAVFLTIPLFITSGASNQFDNTHCTTPAQASCIAKHNTANSANSSWLNWFSGGSRSTQFQFIDLFELVHSPKYESTKTVVPTREG